ncbi:MULTISPECIES: DUF3000 domain-containing protein [Aestuariimicrobium]|uniref:DUF3000 domain-containing protein n=1 Tax=Aestuariimicrobium TaxID=396388 RepID=UPI000684A2FC|nr:MULTISPECIES: DUF3000 domain-containing protein [Aestuariimicrobium]
MSAIPPIRAAADSFALVERQLAEFRWRPEVQVTEIPAPNRIAPRAAAVQAVVMGDGDEIGNGRLVLLHDPAGNEAWAGTFRLVSFARADVDEQMVADPLLPEVGWSWLTDSLTQRHADFTAASGTVTSVASRSFGEMADDPARSEVEIRASWTPVFADPADLVPHLRAWQDLLCTTAGLPSLPDGVVQLAPRSGLRPL